MTRPQAENALDNTMPGDGWRRYRKHRASRQKSCTDLGQEDRPSQRIQHPRNRFSEIERQRILTVMNSEKYGHLPPSQIVPRLADQGLYVASESTMYRLLRRVGQLQYRGREGAPRVEHRHSAIQFVTPEQRHNG